MGKRKPEDTTSIVIDDDDDDAETVDSPMSEIYDRASKHRTCWLHMATTVRAGGKKMKKEEARKLLRVSHCLLTFPTRKRSKRRTKRKFPNQSVINKEKTMKKLNSAEFDSYFQNLWKSFSEEKRTSFAYFDSLWFYCYLKASSKGRVLTWIKRKQIFSKKYVFVPIVCWGHWSLLIFCHLGETPDQSNARTPCMLLLDSLEMADPRRLEPDIRKFVLDIYRSEGRAENKNLIYKIPLLVPKVPQQSNGEECGNYVLYFMKLFMREAPDEFSIKEYPYFMNKNWFSPECLERFLEELE